MNELSEERLIEILDEKLANVPTKADFQDLSLEVSAMRGELSGLKADITEIKNTVQRVDKRTDEDIRALIKDVEQLKLKRT